MAKHYAGVGVREAAPEQLDKCRRVGRYLARHDWVLHTGLAEGADRQFCKGALEAGGLVVVHAPSADYETDWANVLLTRFPSQVELQFHDNDDPHALTMVQQYHPGWDQLTPRSKLFHACNYRMRVPYGHPPVLLTIALQGDRPQEQEFGYLLGRGLLIPSVLIRDLTPEEIKLQLDYYVKRPEDPPKEKTEVVTEIVCEDHRPAPYQFLPPVHEESGAPNWHDSLLPVSGHTAPSLWGAAQAFTQQFRKEGSTQCPCCGQGVNLRPTTIDQVSVRWLIRLVRVYLENGRDWVKCSRYPELKTTKNGGGDYAKTKYWGLIETKSKKSGIWRPTEKGIAYIFNQLKVPQSCLTYNDRAYRFSSVEVPIAEHFEQDPAEYAQLVDGLEKLAYPER